MIGRTDRLDPNLIQMRLRWLQVKMQADAGCHRITPNVDAPLRPDTADVHGDASTGFCPSCRIARLRQSNGGRTIWRRQCRRGGDVPALPMPPLGAVGRADRAQPTGDRGRSLSSAVVGEPPSVRGTLARIGQFGQCRSGTSDDGSNCIPCRPAEFVTSRRSVAKFAASSSYCQRQPPANVVAAIA